MRDHLLFSAEEKVGHEFLLASMAINAVHKMHRPGERTEETMNRVFSIFAKENPVESRPEPADQENPPDPRLGKLPEPQNPTAR